jgi:hypothetical protein
MSSVTFSSATATFYEVQNNWARSQMIDGIIIDPNNGGNNEWSVFDFATGSADAADALLTFASPLHAGQYELVITIYQNYYGNPGHILAKLARRFRARLYNSGIADIVQPADTRFDSERGFP